jgi:putative MFS transporter
MQISTGAAPAADPHGIAARLDALPLTPLHMLVIALCGFGMFCDAIELSMTHVLGTVLSSHGSTVHHDDLTLLMSATFIGGAIGAPVIGWFADRQGRKKVLIATLAGFGVTSIASGLLSDIDMVTAMRLASGLFLGAYLPVMTTYLADILPPGSRGRWVLVVMMIAAVGGAAGPFITRQMTVLQPLGLEGWRWALMLGGIGGILAAIGAFWLPESARWLATVGRVDEARGVLQRFERSARNAIPPQSAAVDTSAEVTGTAAAAPIPAEPVLTEKVSLWQREYRARTLLFFSLQATVPWLQIGFLSASGLVLAKRGLAVEDSLLYTTVTGLGSPIGGLLGAIIADKFERPTLLAFCGFSCAVLAFCFVLAPSPAVLMGAGLLYNALTAIFVPILMVLGAELLPTAVRGSLTTGGYACNRISAIVLPMTLLPLIYATSDIVVFGLLATLLVVVSLVILRYAQRGTRGSSLR